MPKTYSDATGVFNPTAFIKEKGLTLEGTMQDKRTIKTQFGEKPVYTLKVTGGNCRFTQGKEDVDVSVGDSVDVIPPTRLDRQLAQVLAGQEISIECLGRGKAVKGQAPWLFKVGDK